jgi:hypothetical protein
MPHNHFQNHIAPAWLCKVIPCFDSGRHRDTYAPRRAEGLGGQRAVGVIGVFNKIAASRKRLPPPAVFLRSRTLVPCPRPTEIASFRGDR